MYILYNNILLYKNNIYPSILYKYYYIVTTIKCHTI